jgi:hypothetical protein
MAVFGARGMLMKPQPPRTPSKLSNSVHHQLNVYALAASAAGVGLLALAQPAEAKVVYTKTHQVIGFNGIYDLDLTHDATVDFLIQEIGYTQNTTTLQLSRWLFVKAALGNAIAGEGNYASALKAGADIGPGGRFIKGGSNGATMAFIYQFSLTSTRHSSKGDWINVNNRYLGLKFKIKGKTHYGWARLSVRTGRTTITGTLTGYAYETVTNCSIRAGQTRDGLPANAISPKAAAPDPGVAPGATLGTLALGVHNVLDGRHP